MPVNSFVDYPMSWKPEKDILKRPIYQSLAAKLEEDIMNGFLAPDTQLPPQRELADYLDINFTTVTKAYKIAEQRGLVYAVTGRGTFVSPTLKGVDAVSAKEVPRNIIDLAPVSSFEHTNSRIVECAKKTLDKRYAEQLMNYYNPYGMPHQIQAGIYWLKQFGIETDPEHTIISSGAQNGIAISLLGLFEPGDRIAVESFSYSNFLELAKRYGIRLISIACDHMGMLPGELDAACKKSRIKGIFLMPSCSNPTSVVTTPRRRSALAAVIEHHNMIVIEDDAYAFISLEGDTRFGDPLQTLVPERTIYIASVSKPICSGLRTAYLVFPDRYKTKIESASTDLNIKTSSLDADVVTEAILSGAAYDIMKVKLKLAKQANAIYSDIFDPLACIGHPNSLFRWLPIKPVKDFHELEQQLLDRGIKIFHSARFLAGPSLPEQYLRVSLTAARDLKELRRGLTLLRDTLRELGLT